MSVIDSDSDTVDTDTAIMCTLPLHSEMTEGGPASQPAEPSASKRLRDAHPASVRTHATMATSFFPIRVRSRPPTVTRSHRSTASRAWLCPPCAQSALLLRALHLSARMPSP
ncbi:hypothetical protein K438DRAFT_1987374 [Mycena galopus ATCC 62051]|nr:hypothetical protein K438DRAFT_1987374 [Mycena galopus ATCC 62051]